VPWMSVSRADPSAASCVRLEGARSGVSIKCVPTCRAAAEAARGTWSQNRVIHEEQEAPELVSVQGHQRSSRIRGSIASEPSIFVPPWLSIPSTRLSMWPSSPVTPDSPSWLANASTVLPRDRAKSSVISADAAGAEASEPSWLAAAEHEVAADGAAIAAVHASNQDAAVQIASAPAAAPANNSIVSYLSLFFRCGAGCACRKPQFRAKAAGTACGSSSGT